MSKILRAVNFYRDEKDRLNAYTLQLIQPEREVWTCGRPAEFPTIEKGANHD